MRVLLISPEAGENYLTSGFADTINQLAQAYKFKGAEVRVYSPYYERALKADHENHLVFETNEIVRNESYKVYKGSLDFHYYIANKAYFDRSGFYDDEERYPYWDNHYRFSLLASGALNHAIKSGFIPDVVHTHEWGGALAGALVRGEYAKYLPKTKVIFTIHNVDYDFHFLAQDIERVGLPPKDFNIEGYEFWGKVSMLKAGILYADYVTVTSIGYRGQLLHGDLPSGIRGFLETHVDKLHGIQHGIDYAYWDLFANRGQNLVEAKVSTKTVLQKKLGLAQDSSFMLYCHIDKETKATIDMLLTILQDALDLNVQIVFGVSDDYGDRSYLSSLAAQMPEKIALLSTDVNIDNTRKALSASDALFLSHTEEPAASIVLKAMASGVVAITGYNCGCSSILTSFDGTNFKKANALMVEKVWPDYMLRELRKAVELYENSNSQWRQLSLNAYSLRQTWSSTVTNYFNLLKLK